MNGQVSWVELCASNEYRGRWVALDDCHYDEGTAKPVVGTLVDADDDLVELCNRVRDADCHNCAILYVEN
ncbi:MAG: hypothetical protein IPJ34_14395 [Myxococcales bacterium]|nr:hypothetical protein [Myxococcales bacterium]MBL8715300.1 hypothetical protein [Myxococcales bacterium]